MDDVFISPTMIVNRCEQKDTKIQTALTAHRTARQNELHTKGEHSHIRQLLDGRLVEVRILHSRIRLQYVVFDVRNDGISEVKDFMFVIV